MRPVSAVFAAVSAASAAARLDRDEKRAEHAAAIAEAKVPKADTAMIQGITLSPIEFLPQTPRGPIIR